MSVEITSEIFQVGGGPLTSAEDAAIYLVRFGEESALVDAGCGNDTERLLKNIRKAGTDPARLKYLLITHCHFDHTGGAAELKKRTGLKTVAHKLDAPYLESGDNRVTSCKLVRVRTGALQGRQKTFRQPGADPPWREKNRGNTRPRAFAGIGDLPC